MTDAVKRKEPEVEAPAAAPAAAAEAAKEEKPKSPATEAKATEPEAKRLKPAPADAAVVRKQVEYYLSDDNLKHDKFFSEKIASDSEGWLEMGLILSCNKMKAIRASKEDVVAALKDSKLELRDGGAAVRRPGNAALPKLEAKPNHHGKKNTMHAHDGGVIAVFKNIPAEQSWMQIKEKVKEKLPGKVNVWHVSEVNDKSQCFVASPPFDGDVQLFEGLEIEVGGSKVKSEVCYGEVLQQTLKTLPKHIRDKRERESRKRQKERNRPIIVGSQKFVNVGALRSKVREILNSRSDGEALKPEGTDYKLVMALLEFHPRGKDKFGGTTGIKVAKSAQGDSRCFYLVKEGGAEEDVSMKKCIDAVELNPPYVKVEKKPIKDEAEGAKKEGEEAKQEEGKDAKKEESKEEKKEADVKQEKEAPSAKAKEEEPVAA